MALKETITTLVERVMRLKPVRVFQHYGAHRGGLLSQGLSYQAIFAVFAGIAVGFSVLGAVLQSRPDILRSLIDLIAANVPGLIDDGSGEGAIDPETLLESVPFTLTGAIALALLLFTATGWLSSGREAVRALFELPGPTLNPVLAWLKDLGLALAFGAALLGSAALSVWLGGFGIPLMLVLDAAILAGFLRVVSGIRIPFRVLWQGVALGAVALGVLKILGTTLLGGATSNPLLASFAVIIGLLIWFNLVCQAILLSAAWVAVSAQDAGIDLSEQPRDREVGGAQ